MRWYHTLDLPGGSVTPGEYDLRTKVGRLPWPQSMNEMRCLDVGSRDGFYAFEMERRGAEEVISIDIEDPHDVHFPAPGPPGWETVKRELADGNQAFEAARDLLGSRVQRKLVSAYRLDRDQHGGFDFAVIGTLLLHLRDPVGALTAIRTVVDGRLLINEPVMPTIDIWRRRPVAEPQMRGGRPFWFINNPAGLCRIAEAAGFSVVRRSRPYVIPHGEAGKPPSLGASLRGPIGDLPGRLVRRRGMLHVWLLCEPV